VPQPEGYIIISWQTRDEQITKDSAGFKDSKEETKELPGERDNAIRNNARRTQARKTTHGPGWTTSRRGQDYHSQSE